MVTVSVIYPKGEGATFDFGYYEDHHLPLLRERWGEAGMSSVEGLRGVAGPGGGAPAYIAIALLRFGLAQQIEAAMTGPHAAEIMGDVAKFTNVQPVIQINETIGE